MKNKFIGGGVILLLIWSVWFMFSGKISIEDIAETVVSDTSEGENTNPTNFVESLTMDYATIDTDVFIGDTESAEDIENIENNNNISRFADAYVEAFQKKDFKAMCEMRADCNVFAEDYRIIEAKEADYKQHSFEYWTSESVENMLCYTETIYLKNDSNPNPILYTYHVAVEEKKNKEGETRLEFQKPRCEKVVKLPYGDITKRSPYNAVCGANITRILCEK